MSAKTTRLIPPPTAGEMREFAGRFDKREWAILCEDNRFLSTVCEDLAACRILAERVLHRASRQPMGGA